MTAGQSGEQPAKSATAGSGRDRGPSDAILGMEAELRKLSLALLPGGRHPVGPAYVEAARAAGVDLTTFVMEWKAALEKELDRLGKRQ